MKINSNQVGYLLAAAAVGLAGYTGYTMYKETGNYRSITDIQKRNQVKRSEKI